MSAEIIKHTFLGYTLVYSENTEEWEAYHGDGHEEISSSKSLKALKARLTVIDKLKYPRVEVYIEKYRSEMSEGVVTSKAESSRWSNGGNEFWAIVEGKRGKYRAGDIFLKTPQNTEIIKQCKALRKQASNLSDEAYKLEKTLQRFDGKNYKPIEEK